MTSPEENIVPKMVEELPDAKNSSISELSESKEDQDETSKSQELVQSDEIENNGTTVLSEERDVIDQTCSYISLSEEETASNKPDEPGCEDSIIDEEISIEKTFLKKSLIDTHPYKHILTTFKPTDEQLSPVHDLKPCKTIEETPLLEVKTQDELEKAIMELKQEKELGVDLEYSDHGYQALVCLIQISSKDKDYVIDTIALKEHVHQLCEIFVDPSIVKIFHSCENDLKWLQYDFNLFVINMFDTSKAMRHLGYKKVGLDHVLLLNYNIQKDKTLQRADFRKRPLPPLYMDYARTDSHFLIHIYHKLKNELIQAKLLQKLLDDCNRCCRVVFKKIQDTSYHSVREEIIKMHKRQLLVLDELNQWRHQVAKYFDINPGVVLSKCNMRKLILELPVDRNVIINICNSEHVKKHIEEIITILKKASRPKPQQVTVTERSTKPKPSTPNQYGNKRKINQVDPNVNGKHIQNYTPKKVKNSYHGDVWVKPPPYYPNNFQPNFRPFRGPYHNKKNNNINNRRGFI